MVLLNKALKFLGLCLVRIKKGQLPCRVEFSATDRSGRRLTDSLILLLPLPFNVMPFVEMEQLITLQTGLSQVRIVGHHRQI